jgi:hypothetical protein
VKLLPYPFGFRIDAFRCRRACILAVEFDLIRGGRLTRLEPSDQENDGNLTHDAILSLPVMKVNARRPYCFTGANSGDFAEYTRRNQIITPTIAIAMQLHAIAQVACPSIA